MWGWRVSPDGTRNFGTAINHAAAHTLPPSCGTHSWRQPSRNASDRNDNHPPSQAIPRPKGASRSNFSECCAGASIRWFGPKARGTAVGVTLACTSIRLLRYLMARRYLSGIVGSRPLPERAGKGRNHCPPGGEQPTQTLGFFEGENIVSPPQNRRVSDGYCDVFPHRGWEPRLVWAAESPGSQRPSVAFLRSAGLSPGWFSSPAGAMLLRLVHERALSQAMLLRAPTLYRLPALG
jgi:hypothetical protein